MSGQRGQALVVMLMVTALVGLTGGAIMNLATHQADQRAFEQAKHGQLLLRGDINNAMQTAVVCQNILSAQGISGPVTLKWSLPKLEVTSQNAGGGVAQVAADLLRGPRDLPSYNVRFEELTLEQTTKIGPLTKTRDLYSSNLTLKASTLRGTAQYKPVVAAELYLEVENGVMVSCYGRSEIARVTEAVCKSLGATYVKNHCVMEPTLAAVACPDGEYMESFTLGGDHTRPVCKTLPADPGPPPPPPPPAKTTGKWAEISGHWWTGLGNPCTLTYGVPLDQQTCAPIGGICSTVSGSILGGMWERIWRCQ